jgi:hypothetical protein
MMMWTWENTRKKIRASVIESLGSYELKFNKL